MKKLIFTLLISFFALNAVAQEENASPRYELIYQDNEGYKLDTQTGKMWLLIIADNNDKNGNCISRQQYTIDTQILPSTNDQSIPGRYTFIKHMCVGYSDHLILDKVSGDVYYIHRGDTYSTWKLVPF